VSRYDSPMPPRKPALACFLVLLCALPWPSARAARPGSTPPFVVDGLFGFEVTRALSSQPFLVALATPISASSAPASQAVDILQWRSGLTEINEGWATHEGDDLKWAQPAFDDSHWQQVDIEDIGAAQPGWRWFRKHIDVGPDHSNVRLLVEGGDGAYELFVNGARVEGPRLRSAFAVTRPAERIFDLSNDNGDFALALRTRAPANYAAYHLPLFLSVTLGMPTAI
jgi:hypothetical protein